MEWAALIGAIFLAVLIAKLLYFPRKSANSLPGPVPLPFVGNLIYIARQDPINFIALHKISKKYGPIVGLRVGSNKNVLISRSDIGKEIYSRSDCLNRPMNAALQERNLNQNIGMAFSVDEGWNKIRKFTSRAMRDYGFGNRTAMEKLIKDELEHLVKFIENQVEQSKDGVIYFDKFFQVSFLNLMSSMITGRRHDYKDPELMNLAKASNEWFEVPLLGIFTVMAFPWTRYICPGLLGYTQQMNALKKMNSYGRKILERHRKLGNFKDNPACFTDSFLQAAHESEENQEFFSDDQFAVLCTDLIQGGSDTTSNWLSFAVVLLLQNPDVQEKVVKEIGDKIGFNQLPEARHKDSMIYTQAVMLEIHRFARLTVMLPPRVAGEDFVYKDYLIEKGTMFLVNLHSCYMDPDVWVDPEVFRPERFLSDDGKQLVNVENMSVIYGAGRRVCYGEAMAKDSSFLYLTTLLQKFCFKPPPEGYPVPKSDPVPGLMLSPKPFYALVEKRKMMK